MRTKVGCMPCGFSTIVPGTISLTVKYLGEIEKEEIEETIKFLNETLSKLDEKKEWEEFKFKLRHWDYFKKLRIYYERRTYWF